MNKYLVILLIILFSLPAQARKKTKEARPAIERAQVSDADQRRLSHFFLEGVKQKLAGNYSAAHDLFAHCLSIDPTSPEALYEMGYLKFYLREDSVGVVMFQQASELDPQNPYYLETLAAAYLNSNDYTNAKVTLERLSQLRTKRTDVLSQLVELYKTDEEYEKAIIALNRIELLDGRALNTTLQKFNLYMAQGKQNEAFAELSSLEDEQPHDLRIPVMLGREYMKIGEEEKALAKYEQVRRSDPDNTLLRLAMLEYYETKGDTQRHNELRDSIIFSSTESVDLRMPLIYEKLYEMLDKPDAKEQTTLFFDSLTAVTPTADIYTMRAVSFSLLEMDADTVAMAMRDILRVDPTNRHAINSLLPYYIDINDYENVVEVCRIGINSYPEELRFHFYLGLSLYQLGRPAESIEAFENGVHQVNEESEAGVVSQLYCVLGDCYHEQGDEAKAFEAYDKSLEYDGNNSSCLNNYSYYLSLKGTDLEKAEKMAHKATRIEPLNKTFLDTYAWVLFRMGNVTMAKVYIDRVVPPNSSDLDLKLDPDLNAEVLLHAAQIYRANGLTEEAEIYEEIAKTKEE